MSKMRSQRPSVAGIVSWDWKLGGEKMSTEKKLYLACKIANLLTLRKRCR